MASAAVAAELKAGPAQPLQAVLDGSQDGDVIDLAPGDYKGSIRIDRRVILNGHPGAVLSGVGAGNVITVTAPEVTIRGVTIQGSGHDLETMDSGVFLEKTAERALIENNRFEGNLFGIYVHGASGSRVLRNIIEGARGGRLQEAGNGVSLWNAPDVTIADNTFRYGRDGIFTITSRKDRFVNNRFEQVRFAVHYMYTNDSEVSGNVSVGNHVGYAIMYSNRLVIRNNISDRDRDHGMLFNYANYSEIDHNRVSGGPLDSIASSREEGPEDERGMVPELKRTPGLRSGPEKCVFIYNTNHNKFKDNWFEGCGIGVHFTAGSEGNEITGNAFIGNRNQVKYVGTRDSRLVEGRPRQLLERQSGVRSQWRRHRRYRLSSQRSGRSRAVDRAGGEGADQQSGGAGAALGAGPVSGALSRRGRRYPSPDRAAAETNVQPEFEMTATVSVTGVEKSYRSVRALRDVSFDLGPGRLSALVGHNGAGKTTLIKLMLGLIRADHGQIRVLNEDPAAGEFRRAGCSAICRKTWPSTRR